MTFIRGLEQFQILTLTYRALMSSSALLESHWKSLMALCAIFKVQFLVFGSCEDAKLFLVEIPWSSLLSDPCRLTLRGLELSVQLAEEVMTMQESARKKNQYFENHNFLSFTNVIF